MVLALTVTLVPPSLLLGMRGASVRWPAARRTMHLVFVAALLAAIALQLLDDLGIDSTVVITVLALLAGVAGALVYARTRFVPAVMSVLAVAPGLAPAQFPLRLPGLGPGSVEGRSKRGGSRGARHDAGGRGVLQ